MHCHIAFHASAGLALQFVERKAEINEFFPGGVVREYEERCERWGEYYAKSPAKQEDSGI